MSTPRTFHVIHGSWAAGFFREALPAKSVHEEDLSCGPLPPFESAQQWSQLRDSFWDRVALGGDPPSDFGSDFLNTLLSLNDSDSVVFWVGTCASDQLLLRYTQDKGPKATRIIGFTMTDSFDADLAGDGYLFWRLRRMAAPEAAHPLVALSGDPYKMRECDVTLTEAGHEVLAGRANAIELNGIDDWILGVHLLTVA
jgi:hypothetical protein